MRKRQDAPGELERVRAFVNTRDIESDTEGLARPAELRDWLVGNGLASAGIRVTRADVSRAMALREALRANLLSHNDGTTPPPDACRALDEAARRAQVALCFDERGGASMQPAARGVDGALGRLLAIVHRAISDGTWTRLKACRDHTCEWAFYDYTKNRSGTWCTMEECGNRAKARSYRKRRTRPAVQ